MTVPSVLPPGSTIGILGGGQLGRMIAMAAARLGYRCIVYSPEATSPAAEVSAGHVRGGYDDYENFRRAGSAGDYARHFGFDQLTAKL